MPSESTLKTDLEKSSIQLSDKDYLDIDTYTQITSTVLGSITTPQQTQLLSINSSVPGKLFVFVDGEEFGPIYIGVGPTQVPFHSKFKKQFTAYFLPTDETCNGKSVNAVHVSLI